MQVAITGGTGFIGKALVARHLAAGDTVRVLSRRSARDSGLPDGVKVFQGDLTGTTEMLIPFLDGVDVLYHCAGEIRDPEKMAAVHISGTRNLCTAAAGRVKHWVQLSSTGVYGPQKQGVVTEETPENPVGPYEETKAEADRIVREMASAGGYTWSILRPSIVYGPGMVNQSLFQLISMINKGFFFFIGPPGAAANYIHVDNVVEAMILCAQVPAARGRIYNLSARLTIEDFVATIARNLGKSAPRLRLPKKISYGLSRLGKLLPGFPLTKTRVDSLTNRGNYSVDRICKELGYQSILRLEDGLAQLVAIWKQEHYWCAKGPSSELTYFDNAHEDEEGRCRAQFGNGLSGLTSTKGFLWFIYFCYAVVAALLFQKLLLPLVPGLHAGSGLLQGDAAYFHDVAVQGAEAVRNNGWAALWDMVGKQPVHLIALSVLYVVFGQDPSLLIPINAGFHALGGVLIYLLGRELWPGKTGQAGGLVAASLFILFPSALNWYGQLHKDGFAIAGILIILLCWVRLVNRPVTRKNGLQVLAGITVGMFMVASVRPYFVTLLFVNGLLLGVLLGGYILFTRGRLLRWNVLGCWVAALLVLFLGVKLIPNIASGANFHDGMGYAARVGGVINVEGGNAWHWQKTPWLPAAIDGYFEAAGSTRAGLIQHNIIMKAGSGIDLDVAPDNALSVLLYLPRALQISLLAPFPSSWFTGMSMMRLVSVFEMIIWYLCIPGIFLTLFFRRSPALAVAIVFALFFLGVLGFVSPNVGSLYRIRYPFIFVFILIGVLGWAEFLLGRWERKPGNIHVRPSSAGVQNEGGVGQHDSLSDPLHSRSTVFSAGAMVMVLTLFSYVGFFLRDILMARKFGAGDALDFFYIGMMLPMFVVSVFSLPFAGALTPIFQQIRLQHSARAVKEFVRSISLGLTCFLVVLSVILFLVSPFILPLVGWNFSPEKLRSASWILVLFLPILTLSGMVVIGNALLNALGKFFIPGVAQLIVPVTAITTLIVWGDGFGIAAVAFGMVGGQFLNLVVVALYLRKLELSILPAVPRRFRLPHSIMSQYLTLAAAAFFVSVLIPIDNSMASSLEAGSVATLGLGMKVVIFITGLIGAGTTSVMIPYFSQFMARTRNFAARRELSFFLFVTTLVTIPAALLLYVFSPRIISIAFQGGAIGVDDALAITRVMRFGIIQLPFFACGMLVTRFVTANQRAGLVLFSAGIGVVLNVVLNYFLMKWLGVAGIALATTLALAVSTALLILMIRHAGHIAWFEVVLLGLSWLLYLTLVVCLHYQSYTGLFIACAALLWLPVEHIRVFLRMRREETTREGGYGRS